MFLFSQKRTGLVLAGGAIAALLASGCSHQDNTPPAQVNTTTVTPPASAPSATVTTTPGPMTPPGPGAMPSTNNTNAGAGGATGTETAAADAVNKAIHNNAQMTGSRITAVVNASGEARLTGTAQNQQQKALAESTAHQTAGVSSVINKVEIVPTGGVKSTMQPAPKTKIIVVHDQAPAPVAAPTMEAAPMSPAPVPAGPDSSARRTAGTGGTAAKATAEPSSSTGTTAP